MRRKALAVLIAILPAEAGTAPMKTAPGKTAKNLPAETARPDATAKNFRDCRTVCPEMTVVPAGRFTMGSPETEPGRDPHKKGSEDPLDVTIARPFAVGRFAVTLGEFKAFVKATQYRAEGGCHVATASGWTLQVKRTWRTRTLLRSARQPVVCVNWNDAKAYAQWLSKVTGKSYRLLSDSEREYVARAGSSTPFWWGPVISPSRANYNAARNGTVPVDRYPANPWGLYNVHGNVWEWTEDCWNARNAGNPGDGSARQSGDCHYRIVRGGSWFDKPRLLRAAFRYADLIDSRYANLGFRVARSLPAP